MEDSVILAVSLIYFFTFDVSYSWWESNQKYLLTPALN